MRIPTVAACAALMLGACGEPAAAPEASATMPVAVAGLPQTAEAAASGIAKAAAETPEAFIRAVYGLYADGVPSEAATFPAAIWSTRTRTLWAEVEAAQVAEGGVIYEGQLCECNDYSQFQVSSVATTMDGADKASAAVAFTNGGQPTAQTVKLVREGGLWRIDDVLFDPSGEFPQPPMVQGLTEALAAV